MSDWKFQAAGVLGQGLMSGLFTTVRARREGYEPIRKLRAAGQKVILTPWHGTLLPLAYYHRGEGIVVLVSDHADGEYITRVLERFGYQTARGSSTRGGTKGLRGLVRAAREGHDLAITPDGPRGPARVAKPGAVVAAQLTGLPIVPLGFGASAAWRFRSWDSFMVPKPLSQVRLVYGDPIFVPRDAGEEEIQALTSHLGDTLNTLTRLAERSLGGGVDERESRS